MTETTLYRQLTIEQVTAAIARSLEDARFTDQQQVLVILLAQARMLALNAHVGIYKVAEEKSQTRKVQIASALQYFASRAGESDIFAAYEIIPAPRD